MAVIDELLVGLGFDFDEAGLDKFRKGVDDALGRVKRFAVAIGAVTAAAVAGSAKSAELTERFSRISKATGIGVRRLDAWAQASRRAGGGLEAMNSIFASLNKQIGAISKGDTAILQTLGEFGIDPSVVNQGAEAVVNAVRRRYDQLIAEGNRAGAAALLAATGTEDAEKIFQTGIHPDFNAPNL